jgi:hypothetical protein
MPQNKIKTDIQCSGHKADGTNCGRKASCKIGGKMRCWQHAQAHKKGDGSVNQRASVKRPSIKKLSNAKQSPKRGGKELWSKYKNSRKTQIDTARQENVDQAKKQREVLKEKRINSCSYNNQKFGMVGPTLAWVYQFFNVNIDKIYGVYQHKLLPNKQINIKLIRTNVEQKYKNKYGLDLKIRYEDILYYTANGHNQLIERVVDLLLDELLATDEIKAVIMQVLKRESEHRRNGKIVFYHGQSIMFWLHSYIMKKAALRQLENIKKDTTMTPEQKKTMATQINNMVLGGFLPPCRVDWSSKNAVERVSSTSFENRYDLYMSRKEEPGIFSSTTGGSLDDEGPGKQIAIQRLISVNYSIFGNLNTGPECTYVFFSQNGNVNNIPPPSIPFLNQDEKVKVGELRNTFKEMMKGYPGTLLLVAIPCEILNDLIYNSEAHGIISYTQSPMPILSAYLDKELWDSYDDETEIYYSSMNEAQARIVDLCFNEISSGRGVEITRMSSIPQNVKEYLEEQTNAIFQ